MTIQGIGPLDPVSKPNKAEKSEKVLKSDASDSISVSQEAKSKAEVYMATELAKKSEDIRWSRVEEVKRKLEDPNYLSQKVIEETADKIMDHFNL
jgi:negative regulator of flagellin synthesis FlgM